jgi:hypothetical protein
MKSQIHALVVAIGIAATAAVPQAIAAPTAQVTGGYTLVELSSGFVGALTSLQIAPSKALPGALYPPLAYFPIVAGRLDASNARGEIPHSGGLKLTRGATQVILSDFVIDTTGLAPRLTGLVTANGTIVGRIPLFNLALPALTLPLNLPAGPETLRIEGTQVTLTTDAATALNGAFSTTAFVAGFNIGVASVFANY